MGRHRRSTPSPAGMQAAERGRSAASPDASRSTSAGERRLPVPVQGTRVVMTHKYRGCIIVLLINKSVEPNEEQKVLTSGFDQGFTVNTSKRVFRGI
jgi:hypothetical protein